MNKSKLDEIIERHKAQPVGHGYIDIIVSRENYKDFVVDLVNNDYKIESISWWEWCQNGNKSEYGLGGPVSVYFNGWFSELSVEVDDFNLMNSTDKQDQIEEIIQKIETKKISFPTETITFHQKEWLTPAIWLSVPDGWRNNKSA